MRKIFVCLVVASVSVFAQDDERILSYVSDITVNPDASLTVTEKITVRAKGEAIRRGIYRDFPTNYKTAWHARFTTTFEVLEVLRDGNPEPYHTQGQTNGTRLYIGDKDVFLTPGEYEYAIKYRTDHQLAYWDNDDELYWNVTGNGWEFPIDAVEARVHLPRGVDYGKVKLNAYTGVQGSEEQDYEASVDSFGAIIFKTTRPLASYEGLTISTTFQKGLVLQPKWSDVLRHWAQSNRALRFCTVGVLLTLAYYIFAWFLVGRDPAAGEKVVRSEPPKGISPAAARFLMRMRFDHHTFVSALVNLAVKQYVRIDESGETFTITRLKAPDDGCSLEEKSLLMSLLPNEGSIVLKNKNHSRISKAISACHDTLRNQYEKQYFINNYGYFLPGLLLALATIVIALVMSPMQPAGSLAFLVIWISIWSMGCTVLGFAVVTAWRSAFTGVGNFLGALFITAFATPFFAAEVFVLVMIFGTSIVWVLPFVVVLLVLNTYFYQLLKAPTRLGRRALDEIEGFRAYLMGDVANPYRVATAKPALDEYNIFFPYAIAMGIDDEWAKRFEGELGKAGVQDPNSPEFQNLQPYWYNGDRWRRDGMARFSGGIASTISSTISSSATAPGSSSGRSGGGGSSGGGGGGGGGGGW